MNKAALVFSRLLARSLAIVAIAGLLTAHTPFSYAEQSATPEASTDYNSLDALWNQSIDDPKPQIRPITPGTATPNKPVPVKPEPKPVVESKKPAKPAKLAMPTKPEAAPKHEQPKKQVEPPAVIAKPEKPVAKTETPLAPEHKPEVKKTKPVKVARPKPEPKQKPIIPAEPIKTPPQVETVKPKPVELEKAKTEPKPKPIKVKRQKSRWEPTIEVAPTVTQPAMPLDLPTEELPKTKPVKIKRSKVKPVKPVKVTPQKPEIAPQVQKSADETTLNPAVSPTEGNQSVQKTKPAKRVKAKKVKLAKPLSLKSEPSTNVEKSSTEAPLNQPAAPAPTTQPAQQTVKAPKPKKQKAAKKLAPPSVAAPKAAETVVPQNRSNTEKTVIEAQKEQSAFPKAEAKAPERQAKPEKRKKKNSKPLPATDAKQTVTDGQPNSQTVVQPEVEGNSKPPEAFPKAEPAQKKPKLKKQPRKQPNQLTQPAQAQPRAIQPVTQPTQPQAEATKPLAEEPTTPAASSVETQPAPETEVMIQPVPTVVPTVAKVEKPQPPKKVKVKKSKATTKAAPKPAEKPLAMPIEKPAKPLKVAPKPEAIQAPAAPQTKAVQPAIEQEHQDLPTEPLADPQAEAPALPSETAAPTPVAPPAAVVPSTAKAPAHAKAKPLKIKKEKTKSVPALKSAPQDASPEALPKPVEASTQAESQAPQANPPAEVKTDMPPAAALPETQPAAPVETTAPANSNAAVDSTPQNLVPPAPEKATQAANQAPLHHVETRRKQKNKPVRPTQKPTAITPVPLQVTEPATEEPKTPLQEGEQPQLPLNNAPTSSQNPAVPEVPEADAPAQPGIFIPGIGPATLPEALSDASANSKEKVDIGQNIAAAKQQAAQYAELLKQWRQSARKESLEPILNKGQEAALAILKVAEQLSEPEFKVIEQQMQGYLMLRENILVIGPDPAKFQALAQEKGQPVDIAFFELMGKTLNSYWPVTMEQLDDLSGCTRFGSGDLVRLYGLWQGFQKQYPTHYQAALQDPNLLLIHDLQDQLLNSASACDGPETVMDEFKKFVTLYPKSPLTPKIRIRMEALRQDKLDMSFKQGVKYHLSPEASETDAEKSGN